MFIDNTLFFLLFFSGAPVVSSAFLRAFSGAPLKNKSVYKGCRLL
jgi:hypothetical protein